MTYPVNGTKLANLVDPEVMGDLVRNKLTDKMAFANVMDIDYTLAGRPGDTIYLPAYSYIGTATDVLEGADIPLAQLTCAPADVTVKKAGIGVEITDEAVLSGYGDPVGEAASQIALSIGAHLDDDALGALDAITGTMLYSIAGASLVADDIADALVKFGEDIDGTKVLYVSPADYATLRKSDDWLPASDVSAEIMIRGVVGMIHGCMVKVSNKVATKKAFIVKPGALRCYMKRDTMIEPQRQAQRASTEIYGTKHYAMYLYNAAGAIKLA